MRVGEVLGDLVRCARIDQRILASVDNERGAGDLRRELPWSLGAAIEEGLHQTAKCSEKSIVGIREVLARLRLRNGFLKTLCRNARRIGEAEINGALHALLDWHVEELLDKFLSDARYGDHRKMHIAFADAESGQCRRCHCQRTNEIGATGSDLQCDSTSEGVAEQVHRPTAEVIDEINDRTGVTKRSHVAVARGWRLTEAAKIYCVTVDLIAHRIHQIGPVERGSAQAVNEDGDRQTRLRRLGVTYSQRAMHESHVGARPWWCQHCLAHMTRLPKSSPRWLLVGSVQVMTAETVRAARLPKAERRAQLLEAALEVFSADGYHAAGMDQIAERAGVTKPVLYQHFPSKLDLYLALLDSAIDELLTATNAAIASTNDNKLRVRATLDAYFGFVDARKSGFRLVFESDLMNEPAVRDRVQLAESAIAESIAQVIATDTGLRDDQALLLGSGLQGTMEIAARRWVRDPGDISREEAAELVATLCWRGIGGFPMTHPPA